MGAKLSKDAANFILTLSNINISRKQVSLSYETESSLEKLRWHRFFKQFDSSIAGLCTV